jgi:hypothetical protein
MCSTLTWSKLFDKLLTTDNRQVSFTCNSHNYVASAYNSPKDGWHIYLQKKSNGSEGFIADLYPNSDGNLTVASQLLKDQEQSLIQSLFQAIQVAPRSERSDEELSSFFKTAKSRIRIGRLNEKDQETVHLSIAHLRKGRGQCDIFSIPEKDRQEVVNPYYLYAHTTGKDRILAEKFIKGETSLTLGLNPIEGTCLFDVTFLRIMQEFSLFSKGHHLFSHIDLDRLIAVSTHSDAYVEDSNSYWKKVLSDFEKNPSQPLLLLSGYNHHAAITIFLHQYVIIIDTDDQHRLDKASSITIYQHDKKISPALLNEIANYSNRDRGLSEKQLIEKWDLKPVASIGKKYQKTSTCTKSSSFGACLALIVLEQILKRETSLDQRAVDSVYQSAYSVYKQFSSEQRGLHILLYLDHLQKKDTLSPDDTEMLVGIAEKLSIFNRKITRQSAEAILEACLQAFKKFKKELSTLQATSIQGCLIQFSKQMKMTDTSLFAEGEAIGARKAFFSALRSDRKEIDPFLKEYVTFYDINAQDENGHTPLFYAAAFASASTIEKLMRAGAKVDIRDTKGRYPIFYACQPTADKIKGPLGKLANHMRLEQGAFYSLYRQKAELLFRTDAYGHKAFDQLMASSASYPVLKSVCADHPDWFNDSQTANLLSMALEWSDFAFIETITKSSKVFSIDRDLIIALIEKNHFESIVKIFGPKPPAACLLELMERSRRNDKLFESIVEKYGFDSLAPSQRNELLSELVYTGNLPMIKRLVKEGARLSSSTTGFIPPIHSAITKGNKELVEYLVEQFPELGDVPHPIDRETARVRIERRNSGQKKWN